MHHESPRWSRDTRPRLSALVATVGLMAIRRVPEITAEQENFRLEQLEPGNDNFTIAKRDPVRPVPEGTIVVMAFRVTGYDPDCDGSLMARLENIDATGEPTGWEETAMGLYPTSTWMVDDVAELDHPSQQAAPPAG